MLEDRLGHTVLPEYRPQYTLGVSDRESHGVYVSQHIHLLCAPEHIHNQLEPRALNTIVGEDGMRASPSPSANGSQ